MNFIEIKSINGPSNVIRLQNNNIIIYIFIDKEYPINIQSLCSNVRNIDINKYFVHIFDESYIKNPKIHYNFMISAQYINTPSKNTHYGNYMREVLNITRETFPNITFDIIFPTISKELNIISTNIKNKYLEIWNKKTFTIKDLIDVKDGLTLYILHMEKIYMYINDDNKTWKQLSNIIENINNNLSSIAKDIDITRNDLTSLIISNKVLFKEENIDINDNTITEKIIYDHEFRSKVYSLLMKVDYNMTVYASDICGYIIALYVCNKLNVENKQYNILYASEMYGLNCIFNLVKFCKYKITHAFYINDLENDIKNIFKNTDILIRQSKSYSDIYKIFAREINTNCINFDLFPQVFT
jgi:hypothetical protein